MSELQRLVAQRGRIKGAFTRLRTYLADDSALLSATKEALTVRRERLQAYLSEYNAVCDSISVLDPNDSENNGVFEELYFESIAKIDETIGKSNPILKKPPSNSKINLPPVTLPFFSGVYKEFTAFMSLFTSLIDKDDTLMPVQKLYYLRSNLVGEPLNLIINLPLEDSSYPEALAIIKNRYDNKAIMISEHINALFDLGKVQRPTPGSIRELLSAVRQQMASLKGLGQPVDHWDSILVCLLVRKLDPGTARAFQLERDQQVLPSIKSFLKFLENRALALEGLETTVSSKPIRVINAGVSDKKKQGCLHCSKPHRLYKCPSFKMLPVQQRIEFVERKKMCNRCLNEHKGICRFRFKCSFCKQGHSSLLHWEKSHDGPAEQSKPVVMAATNMTGILLPTAKVSLRTHSGGQIIVRALLDSASQASLIMRTTVERLGLQPRSSETNIIGICNSHTNICESVDVHIQSLLHPWSETVNCFITEQITTRLPQNYFECNTLNTIKNELADSDFNVPGVIEILLAADVFFRVLLPPVTSRTSLDMVQAPSKEQPQVLNTWLGKIVAGKYEEEKETKVVYLSLKDTCLERSISRFWELEKVPQVFAETSTESTMCEQIFQHTAVLKDDRFSVAIPLKVPLRDVNKILGDSFNLAYARFINLEKRFRKDPELFLKYRKFIQEYLELQHGKYIDLNSYDLSKDPVYFLTHHPVFNESSKSTSMRVVYDGSMLTSNKTSLNDLQFNGVVVQKDLFEILISFRLEKYYLVTDITKMFRNVFVHQEYRSLQNILWRDSPEEAIRCIQLSTVTYGLKSSSFLATRCLLELANRFGEQYPLAAQVIKNNTYVDDILATAPKENLLYDTYQQLEKLLSLASFTLHKWASNSKDIMETIPKENHLLGEVELQKEDISMKTLGVTFDINTQSFKISCPEKYSEKIPTKRNILSYISKFFDPMGFAGPLLVKGKIFMQELWKANLGWDENIPHGLEKLWLEFAASLSMMKSIHIPRCIIVGTPYSVQLISFADASQLALGCACYLRQLYQDGTVKMRLLCSKSRVAPMNKSITIPKLELNAALLMVKTAKKVRAILIQKINISEVHYHTDSQIVLAWINTQLIKLRAYVANRVKVINEESDGALWHFIDSKNNSADDITRGLSAAELKCSDKWWNGPSIMHDINYSFHTQIEPPNVLPETVPPPANKDTLEERCVGAVSVSNSDLLSELIRKYSNINKLKRVFAYVLRFCSKLKHTCRNTSHFISAAELESALQLLIKHEQLIYFDQEIKQVSANKQISGNLKPLFPFIDNGLSLLRVGGRLQHAQIPYSQKHPIILHKQSRLTELIVNCEHLRLLHAGPKLVLATINQKYWIVDGLRFVKKVTRGCVKCFKLKAAAQRQLMGSLPEARVNVSRPFEKVGVDHAGPLSIKLNRLRKPIISKGYISVWVCLVTKAIHLELSEDLTTDSFLACFKRFIGRRGLPAEVHMDNSTTFKGAKNKLDELYRLQASSQHQQKVQHFAANKGIAFKFIPAYSPTVGGIWERAVGCTKFFLQRAVAKEVLTYEQFYTVLVEIEAILNSRPLAALSTDIENFDYLTPGHFLINAPLTAYPERDLSNTHVQRLKFWEKCTRMKQAFWRKWHKQYLCELQSRSKWRDAHPNVSKGSLVVLIEQNTPPLYYPMARITKLFYGVDGRVRTVEVKSESGHVHVRSITKVCVLPIET